MSWPQSTLVCEKHLPGQFSRICLYHPKLYWLVLKSSPETSALFPTHRLEFWLPLFFQNVLLLCQEKQQNWDYLLFNFFPCIWVSLLFLHFSDKVVIQAEHPWCRSSTFYFLILGRKEKEIISLCCKNSILLHRIFKILLVNRSSLLDTENKNRVVSLLLANSGGDSPSTWRYETWNNNGLKSQEKESK